MNMQSYLKTQTERIVKQLAKFAWKIFKMAMSLGLDHVALFTRFILNVWLNGVKGSWNVQYVDKSILILISCEKNN